MSAADALQEILELCWRMQCMNELRIEFLEYEYRQFGMCLVKEARANNER